MIFPVARDNLDSLGGGTLTLTYQVKYSSAGITSPASPATVYGVIAGGLVLLAPIVLEAPGNVLNPWMPSPVPRCA